MKKILRQAVAMFAFAFTGVTEAEEINDASVEKIGVKDEKNAEEFSVHAAFQH